MKIVYGVNWYTKSWIFIRYNFCRIFHRAFIVTDTVYCQKCKQIYWGVIE